MSKADKPVLRRLQDYIEAALKYNKPLNLVPHCCPVCVDENYYGIAMPVGWEYECPNHAASVGPDGEPIPAQHILVVPVNGN